MENLKEAYRYPHIFFQNSSSSPSSSLEIGSSQKSRVTTNGIPRDSHNDLLPSYTYSNKEEPKEKDFANIVHPSSHKDSSSPFAVKRFHKPIPPSPHRMKKKDQANVNKTRETFFQVKINIPLLDTIRRCLLMLYF